MFTSNIPKLDEEELNQMTLPELLVTYSNFRNKVYKDLHKKYFICIIGGFVSLGFSILVYLLFYLYPHIIPLSTVMASTVLNFCGGWCLLYYGYSSIEKLNEEYPEMAKACEKESDGEEDDGNE